jgi:hypothetical protein
MLRRVIATADLLLIAPAAFFMAALIVRGMLPVASEPAQTADQIVMWYAGRMWTLWLLLLALPIGAFASGLTVLQHTRLPFLRAIRTDASMLVAAVTTVLAAAILIVVILHMLAN